jgi:NAD(P)-dependent dehydrogenase (short-subunit alcohol dehydrogenase family)
MGNAGHFESGKVGNMKHVVVTGSTRGFGFGLAEALLERDCTVSISGRTRTSVDLALKELSAGYQAERMMGQPCDVSDFDQIAALWDASKERFGQVDIWINNAGIAHPLMDIQEMTPAQVAAVIETNLLGAIYGSQVALTGMLAQGFGSIYVTSGHGGDGRKQDGLSLYGTSKAGLRYFTDSLMIETKDSPVLVGELRPGMVVTDLLTGQFEYRPEEWENAKRIFNILADRVETVAPWMVDRILENDKHGVSINWYRRGKLAGRFLAAPFRKRDIVG